MQFLNDLSVFHYNGKEIPCVVEKGAPTHQTEGAIGALYMDSLNGNLYKCVAADSTSVTYNWVIVGAGDADEIRLAVESYFTRNPISAAGLTSTEKNLMLTLFKNIPYTVDVSAAYKSLEALWTTTGDDSDDTENSSDPAVTYHSVTYDLTGVTAGSSASSIVSGGSLTVDLTPDTNAVLGEVTVTMGGVDITATAYSSGRISISSVTGDVVITAAAAVANYTQVEYLEAAATTAYMVTPCSLQPTDLIECVWTNPDVTQWVFPFGAYTNGVHCSLKTRPDNIAGRTGYTRRSGASYTNQNETDPDFIMPLGNAGVYRFAESAPGTGTIYDADGNALVTLTDENVSGYSGTGCPLGLFCIIGPGTSMHGSSAVAGTRIHSFKITNVYGAATLDLIPVLDENNVACMYDKVSGEFIYDASGANDFTAGGAV